jgi:hypothetical protein
MINSPKKSPIYQFLKISGHLELLLYVLYAKLSMKSPCLWAVVWPFKASSKWVIIIITMLLDVLLVLCEEKKWALSLSLLKNLCNFLNKLFKFPITRESMGWFFHLLTSFNQAFVVGFCLFVCLLCVPYGSYEIKKTLNLTSWLQVWEKKEGENK